MKEVKIIGLSINKQFGILQACKLNFDKDNRLTTVKGAVGEGKTTLQKGLQLGTQGSKTLIDKNLYGEIDLETQLLDGETPIWVGCRSDKKGKLIYTIYTKDNEGFIVKEPIIDGIKATPAKYLETLQTELTWKMNELTSENATVQKKILLKLYQHKLRKAGVIFDKNVPEYKGSILDQIDKAEADRSYKDSIRKTVGGIAEDLRAQGFDISRPETLPERNDTLILEEDIKKNEKEIAISETKAEAEKNSKLEKLKTEAAEINTKAVKYNNEVNEKYIKFYAAEQKIITKWNELQNERAYNISQSNEAYQMLQKAGYNGEEIPSFINNLVEPENKEKEPVNNAKKEQLIVFDEKNQILVTKETVDLEFVQEVVQLRLKYKKINELETVVETKEFYDNIEKSQKELNLRNENNKICDAIDSFFEWQKSNELVIDLKRQYARKLAEVDTGVEGLRIVPEEADTGKIDLYLMYNGAYDIDYFNNPNEEYRKLSSYSGTQKPIVCLLIQNHLLNQKPKSMRYMYIDNVPTDNKTIELLKTICYELKLSIFLNMTGDFEQSKLSEGEYLIEGGEVFF